MSGFSLHRYSRADRINKYANFELELTKIEFNLKLKWPRKVIQGHILWGQ